MSFVELGSTTRLYAALHARGFCRQKYRRIEAVWSPQICIDLPIVHGHKIPSEARGEAGLVGGVFGSLRRSWVSRRIRQKLLRRCHLLLRHPADATLGSTL